MFSLFTSKISGVLSLALQGISKAAGLVLDTLIDVAGTVLDTVSAVTAPLTDTLTNLPLVGETISKVFDAKDNLVNGLSEGLQATADQLSSGDLLGGVSTLLDGTTSLVGQAVTETAGLAEHVVGLTSPVTDLLGDVPVLGGLLDVAGETAGNLIGLVGETGEYVSSINPVDLVGSLLADPLGTAGGALQDVSGTVDALLDDLAPLTDTVSGLPVVGDIVAVAGDLTAGLNQGIYDFGAALKSNTLDLLDTPVAYV